MTKSEQARADAMADAETLRLAAPFLRGRIFDATYAIDWPQCNGSEAKHHAYISAQCAFRAVPGLRDE